MNRQLCCVGFTILACVFWVGMAFGADDTRTQTEEEKVVIKAGGEFQYGYVKNWGDVLELGEKWRGEAKDWEALRALARTQTLGLGLDKVSVEAFAQIGKMPKLEKIIIRRGTLDRDQWRALTALKNVKELVIFSPEMDEIHVLGMKNLSSLSVSGSKIKIVEVVDCQALLYLGMFSQGTFVTDVGRHEPIPVRAELSQLPMLDHLAVGGIRVTNLRPAEFKTLRGLEILERFEWSDANDSSLAGLTKLASLDICESGSTATLWASLRGSNSLQSMKFSSYYTGKDKDKLLGELTELPQLESVTVTNGTVSSEALGRLKLPKLRELNLESCEIKGDAA